MYGNIDGYLHNNICENNPNLLFARKFNEDDKILDLLDKK